MMGVLRRLFSRKGPRPYALPRRPRVYISGPITNGGGDVNWTNVYDAIKVGLDLMADGYAPFIPHLSCFADGPPELYEDWLSLDFAWIDAADVLLRLPGRSTGAAREVVRAIHGEIPVVCSLDELHDWYIGDWLTRDEACLGC